MEVNHLIKEYPSNPRCIRSFGDNSKTRTVDIGSVDFASSTQVEEVFLVEGLKHNLLSISQLCDKTNIVIFEKN